MKATFSINMYSGTKNPEMKLSDKQSKDIMDLALKLENPIEYKLSANTLSANIYLVEWVADDDSIIACLIGSPYGILVYRNSKDAGAEFEDTVELWPFLNSIGGYLLQKHYKNNF